MSAYSKFTIKESKRINFVHSTLSVFTNVCINAFYLYFASGRFSTFQFLHFHLTILRMLHICILYI